MRDVSSMREQYDIPARTMLHAAYPTAFIFSVQHGLLELQLPLEPNVCLTSRQNPSSDKNAVMMLVQTILLFHRGSHNVLLLLLMLLFSVQKFRFMQSRSLDLPVRGFVSALQLCQCKPVFWNAISSWGNAMFVKIQSYNLRARLQC